MNDAELSQASSERRSEREANYSAAELPQPGEVIGLRWGGTGDGGGNLWLTTADGDGHEFSLDNNTTNVLLRALLADATIRIEASGQVMDSR